MCGWGLKWWEVEVGCSNCLVYVVVCFWFMFQCVSVAWTCGQGLKSRGVEVVLKHFGLCCSVFLVYVSACFCCMNVWTGPDVSGSRGVLVKWVLKLFGSPMTSDQVQERIRQLSLLQVFFRVDWKWRTWNWRTWNWRTKCPGMKLTDMKLEDKIYIVWK